VPPLPHPAIAAAEAAEQNHNDGVLVPRMSRGISRPLMLSRLSQRAMVGLCTFTLG